MEIKLQNSKFWIIQNKIDEKRNEQYIYDDEASAISSLKKLMKTTNVEKLVLSSVYVGDKDWKIASVPWSIIAMGMVKEGQ